MVDDRTRSPITDMHQPVAAGVRLPSRRQGESEVLLSPTFPLGGGWDDPNCARRTSISPLPLVRAGEMIPTAARFQMILPSSLAISSGDGG